MPSLVRNHPGLPLDVWYLVFHWLGRAQCRRDLYSLCLACKDFQYLATPTLYHSISLQALHEDGLRRLGNLLDLLAQEGNDRLRAVIREVIICPIAVRDFLETAFNLVCAIPSLQRVIIKGPVDIPRGFLEHLRSNGKQKLDVHLLDQDGTRPLPTTLPQVSSLHAEVDQGAGINQSRNARILNLQNTFFACPKLRSFSLAVYGIKDDPTLRDLMFPSVSNFQLTGEEVFPAVQELSLSGYQMSALEWPHWRDGFAWSELSSLALGPDLDVCTFHRLIGHTRSLRHLTLLGDTDHDSIPQETVNRFLLSFNTLTHLTLEDHFCSAHALSNHPNLTSVSIHDSQDFLAGTTHASLGWIHRTAFTAGDLSMLDLRCPNLEDLGIDIMPEDSHGTSKVLTTLASKFVSLRSLSLHLPLGIVHRDYSSGIPQLNRTSAYNLGGHFCAMRYPRSLRKLRLQIGDPFRQGRSPRLPHVDTIELQPYWLKAEAKGEALEAEHWESFSVSCSSFSSSSSSIVFKSSSNVVFNLQRIMPELPTEESFEIISRASTTLMDPDTRKDAHQAYAASDTYPDATCHRADRTDLAQSTTLPENNLARPASPVPGLENTFGAPVDIVIGDTRRGRLPVRRRYGGRHATISPDSSNYSTSPDRRPRRGEGASVASHHELFSSTETNDRVVYIQPFRRNVYITSHSPAPVDFRHWFHLLTTAVPDSWYSFVPADALQIPGQGALHRPPPYALKLQWEPRPVAFKFPSIAASSALKPTADEPTDLPPLVYLSVQQSVTGRRNDGRYYSPDRRNQPDASQSIYRVVRAGSRDHAAAQALYHAGMTRWSTVFTCVVKDTDVQPRYNQINAYERVQSLQQLVDTEDTPEKMLVFY
ncbi:hypothetical protein FE257_009104 [Aspergillus nanangensis]|uniref:F-box domain-containing protein n=1 Tax=Aspergillus nanangensis TaxID=2582783 RepID=A0AAD4GYP1_ASPNN|nr:hypothetical protein FE257_009104 [Aspergillus nanangensis]